MKSALLPLAIVGLVAAQGDGAVPRCAQPCVNEISTGGKIGGCPPLEIECICSNGNLLDSIACCLERECDEAGKDAAVTFASRICGGVGVTDIPTAVSCSTGAGASSTQASTTTDSSASDRVTDAPSESTGTEDSSEQSTTSGADSQETDDGDAAAGLSAPMGLMGAVLLGWVAL